MNKNLKRLAGIGVATAIGLGGLAVTAPSASAATGRGSASVSEVKKVNKQMHRQWCLTRGEVRKIVHGRGTLEWTKGSKKAYIWDGAGVINYFEVRFRNNCAYRTEYSVDS